MRHTAPHLLRTGLDLLFSLLHSPLDFAYLFLSSPSLHNLLSAELSQQCHGGGIEGRSCRSRCSKPRATPFRVPDGLVASDSRLIKYRLGSLQRSAMNFYLGVKLIFDSSSLPSTSGNWADRIILLVCYSLSLRVSTIQNPSSGSVDTCLRTSHPLISAVYSARSPPRSPLGVFIPIELFNRKHLRSSAY